MAEPQSAALVRDRGAIASIPFHIPWTDEKEAAAAADAIRGNHIVGDGVLCRRVEAKLKSLFGVRHVLLTTSCTHAMELAILCLGIRPGDEVIMPSFTFSSTANAVVLRGARPVFAEIRPDTLTLDSEDVRRKLSPRTKVIMPVHYAGVACDMDPIMALAEAHGIRVVEDAAQGVDAQYKGRYLGTLGHIGCYSFHHTKNITCGEGGAFLTNDDSLVHKAEIIREKGTNRSAFLRGEVDKYTWVAPGSSYVLSDILAAVLEAQLEKREEIKKRRRAIWEAYYACLKSLDSRQVILPHIPAECESNYHIFFFRVRSQDMTSTILSRLRAAGIGATFHYVPLHSSPQGTVCAAHGELAFTTEASSTLIRLPIYPGMTANAVTYVAETVRQAVLGLGT